MLKKTLILSTIIVASVSVKAQTEVPKPATTITGAIDAYFRSEFSNQLANNKTSFTNSLNSFELGMATLRVDHKYNKVSATVDLGFGRRAAEFSYNDNGSLAVVKQLFVTYAPSDKLKFSLGKWTTHIGWELLDAYANRNYSMSYGFSYGPFSHTGFKADISLGGKTSLMLGVANPTDYTSSTSSTAIFISQLSTATKNDKLKVYLNYQGGSMAGYKLSQIDLVINGILSDKFNFAYDGTIQSRKVAGTSTSWSSNALYLNYDPTPTFGLTLRGEYFSDKKSTAGVGAEIFVPTLSANIKVDNLTIIPEIRLDAAKENIFVKSSGAPAKTFSQFILAATYHF
ncbi:MAG: outer membrane beta-barrel protein [Chitinophagaceae bacterium]